MAVSFWQPYVYLLILNPRFFYFVVHASVAAVVSSVAVVATGLLRGTVTSPKTKAVTLPKRHIGEKNRRSHIAEK